MNGEFESEEGPNDEDCEEDEEEDDGAPMPVDEFIALPTFHKKKVAFYKHMVSRGVLGADEDDGT